MESQVLVCSADVAAFVDALETIGYPVDTHTVTDVEDQQNDAEELDVQTLPEATYLIEETQIANQTHHKIIQVDGGVVATTGTKRFRINPKQQKEIIELLFEKQKAVVTEKAFMNLKGNKRFKSDVWSWFGDVKLLISKTEAKKLDIPVYYRSYGEEKLMLSKLFVGCFRCNALFIHNSQRSGTSTLRAHMRVCSRPRLRKKKGAPTIIFIPTTGTRQPSRIASDDDKLLAREHLLDYILSSESPFDIIDHPEFRKVLQMCISIGANYGDINVESMLCPPEKLSDFMLNDTCMTSTNAFYTEFQYLYGAAFTFKIWMDEQQSRTYLSMVCHYTTLNGESKKVVLQTDEFLCETKTPEDVRDSFNNLLKEMAVTPIKKLMVTDNISNLVIAFKDEECVRCAYQNLNLAILTIIQTALSANQNEYGDFVALLSSCKEIVLYFEQISLQYQLPEPLKLYKEESWLSILSMFKSIYNQYDDILNILNQTGQTHLLSVEKLSIGMIIDFFQEFEDAQTELFNFYEPTLNIVLPLISRLEKHCLQVFDDSPILQQMKTAILLEINERLSSNITIYHRVATLLDPRYKRHVYTSRDDQINATNKIKALVKEFIESPILNLQNDENKKDHTSDIYSIVPNDTGNIEKSANREVDNYLMEPFSLSSLDVEQQTNFNPMKFWVNNNDKYPNLRRVAMFILSCPAVAIESEESLWTNEWLVNCARVHHKPEHINKVLFVKSYKNL